MSTLIDAQKGIILEGPVTNIAAAAAANAAAIFQISNFAQQIGTKSLRLHKLLVRNNAGGNLWLAVGIGVGAAFVAAIPELYCLNNIDNIWQEVELPAVELFADITAYPATLVAGGSVDVQVTVREIG